MGTVISLPISGVLCDYLGWESVFYVFGCLGLVWFICWTIFVYDNPEKWVHTELKDLSFGKKSFCFITFRFFPSQCDQMVILLIQYLAIYSNEHLPQYRKNAQTRFKILPNMKETLQKLPNILKCSPKWRNFAKSGHTVPSSGVVLCSVYIVNRERSVFLARGSNLWQALIIIFLMNVHSLKTIHKCFCHYAKPSLIRSHIWCLKYLTNMMSILLIQSFQASFHNSRRTGPHRDESGQEVGSFSHRANSGNC